MPTIGVFGKDGKTLVNVDFPSDQEAKAAIKMIADAVEDGAPAVLRIGEEAMVRTELVSHAMVLASFI